MSLLPKISISIPSWVWILLVLFVVAFLAYCIYTPPDPQPSFKNIIQHLLGVWARDAQNLFKHPSSSSSPRTSNPPFTGSSLQQQDHQQRSGGFESRGESICRRHMEDRFGEPFPKARPSCLRNPVTGENLELDIYNETLGLAVEYNGKQHYHFNSHFHRGSNDRFQNQQYRDLIKKQLCEENGIFLITVPYSLKDDEIPGYLDQKLDEFKMSD